MRDRGPGARTASAGLAAGLAGVALWAAHPPAGVPTLAWLVAPLLVVALRAASGDALDPDAPGPGPLLRFGLGLLAGLIAYGTMLGWIAYAGGTIAWLLLVPIQAAWVGVWSLLIGPRLGSRLLPLHGALLWVGIEWLRTRVPLGGFAWGRLAYSQVESAWLVPLGRVLGASGISLVVVLAGLALLQAVLLLRRSREPDRTAMSQLVVPVLMVALTTIGPPPTAGVVDVLVVQGNDIRHWERPVADAPLVIAEAHRDLTLAAVAAAGPPDVTVWPESSLDRDPSRPRGAPLWTAAAEAVRAAGTLVAGVSLDGPDPRTQRIIGAVVLGPEGERDRYVKRQTVPFGEYVPARSFLDWIPALDQVPRDAVRGEVAASVEIAPGVRAAIAYCFETLFPEVVRTNVLADEAQAGIVLTLTNDASFRDSAQPEQHLAQSRMRAIETGRWVAHAAISGVSAFVDPEGRVHDRTESFTLATIRREVPLAVGATPYLRLGDVTGLAGTASVAVAVLGSLRGRRRRRGPRPRRPAA